MPIYQITLAFNMDQVGWTENFYRQADTAKLAADFGGTTGDAGFMAIRSNQVTLYSVRARRVDGNHESYIRFPQIQTAGGSRGPAAPPPPNRDDYTTAVYVRWSSNAVIGPPAVPPKSRASMIRGCPDAWVNWDNSGFPILTDADLVAAFGAYKFVVTSLQFANQIRVPIAGNKRMNVVSMTQNPNNRGQTIVAGQFTDPLLVEGSRVTFGQVPRRDLPYLTGSYPVFQVVPGTSFVVNYRMIWPSYSPAGMYCRVLQYQYPLITSGQMIDFRSHRTGRPTERYVGRRSAPRVSH